MKNTLIIGTTLGLALACPFQVMLWSKEPDVRIILEQEVIVVPMKVIPYLPGDMKPPSLGSWALLDKRQAKTLSDCVDRGYRLCRCTLPTLNLRDGDKWRDSGEQSYYEFQPRISDHRQAIKLHVVFALGDDRLVVDESIPQGSSLLVHHTEYAHAPEAICLEQLADWIFRDREPTPEYSEAFLLVTPRLASQEEPQQKAGTK